jgi:glycosyltransferase involved in cell wall biosynthesis
MKNKEILFLAQSFIRFKDDITSHFLFSLAQGIQKSGVAVKVVVPHQKGLKDYEKIGGLPLYRFHYMQSSLENLAYSGNMQEIVKSSILNRIIFLFFLFSYFWKAYRVTKSSKIKIIHAHWWIPSGLVGVLVSSLLNKPLIITTHGSDIRLIPDSRLSVFLAKFVFKKAKYVTVVSSFLKEKLVSEISLPAEKILVIPMPVNPDKIRIIPLPEPKPKKIILCVARYTRQKKLEILLESLSFLKEENMDFEAVLIGDGPEREKLVKKIEELSLKEKVKLKELMSQEELNRYYNLSDVVVLPSVNEGFGLVLVEAGLCKKPVIGTNSGGIPDIIQDGVTGLLIPPEDSRALALAIKNVLKDENLASSLSQNAYKQAWDKFSPQAITKRFLEIYDELFRECKLSLRIR